MKIILWFLIIVVVILTFIWTALGAYLYINQRKLLYYPQPYTQSAYSSLSINSVASRLTDQPDAAQLDMIVLGDSAHTYDAEGNVLSTNSAKPAILYFGGNAEAVINSAPLFEPLTDTYTIYLANYRGYGQSTGQPSEQNLYADALVVYDVITAQNSQREVSVVGRSLGTGVATYLASKRQVDKVVLITPYDSVLAVAQAAFSIFPVKWLLKDKFLSIKRAPDITGDVFMLVAENDQMIKPGHAEALAGAFNEKPSYHVIANTDHNDIMTKTDVQQVFYDFLRMQ